jgi:prepilin-type N-terminal cleavage/methylation domain-containing protein
MPSPRRTNGFTLIELMLALIVGLVVVSAAMSSAVSTFQTVRGTALREGVNRNARFVAMSLERDFLSTGVGIASTTSFGALAVWGDTAVVLRVPYTPTLAPPYDIVPDTLSLPAVGQGTCGSRCLDLAKASGTFTLAVGDLARMQIQSERRLIVITNVNDPGGPTDTVQVQFANLDTLVRYPGGLTGLQIPANGAFVQQLAPVIYWPENGNVMRAERFADDGSLIGDVMASGVQSWETTLIFTDGDELDLADANDGDATNDYNDILSVRIRATLAADRVDQRVNSGTLFTRDYAWRFSPRNLMYERNRN